MANYQKVTKYYVHDCNFWVAYKPNTRKYLYLSNKGVTHMVSKKSHVEQQSKIAKPSLAKYTFFTCLYIFVLINWLITKGKYYFGGIITNWKMK